MSESCEIYVKPHVAFNLIDVALEGHSGMLPRAAQNIYLLVNSAQKRSGGGCIEHGAGYENYRERFSAISKT